ncbi:unnamed protein product [Closterium sp. NIES-64]|nr:unnamed protein product [Closterium sp. NIES-64]CAI5972282.1 unnamed protein product [Closterium sp. NIES-65]
MAPRSCLVALLAFLLVFQTLSAAPQVQAEETKDVGTNGDLPKVEEPIGAVPTGSTTDTQTQEREKSSMRRSGEKFQFQAEVHRLMDIIINSLYSNKDVFLRELISNASDALDKIRFLSLTDKSILGEGDNTKLEIQIKLDKDRKILSIRDRGIGMTKDDLIKNLGTIAKSGTSAFLERMQKSGDINLIGQFGVGFYSVYLVGDRVEVRSKHNDDSAWVWASAADGNFEVYPDDAEEDEPLGRGTEIRIHLKEEASEYLSEDKLKELVKKYSQFINFPIYMWGSREVDEEVPVDEEEVEKEEDKDEKDKEDTETEEEEDKDSEDESEDEEKEEEEDKEKKPKTRVEKRTKWEWELLNSVKAIWLRSPKDVTDDEYREFYKSLAKDYSTDKPLSWTHFSAEGDVEFKAVLFIPPRAAYDMYDNYYANKAALKLYVRRVFISEEFEELLPKYLNFLKGLVDSDSLPLNVSREMLQAHSSLKTIRKKLVRKALDMIRRLAEDEEEAKAKAKEEREKEGIAEDDKERVPSDAETQYEDFWREFGRAMKLGVIEDSSNRMRLAKLLRFKSSNDPEKLTSLEQYVSRMKPGQKAIYYVTGPSREQLERSPFIEKLLKKGFEVLYLTEPVDEYLMQNLTDFDDKKFQNASKEDLKLGGKKSKEKEKAMKEGFKDLLAWWKEQLGSKEVEAVKLSERLASSPCVVVTSKYGWSANMERIMTSQALGDPSRQSYLKGRKILEVNPRHPIVQQLKELVAADPKDETAVSVASTLYETALIESGFSLEDPTKFAARIFSALKTNLKIDPDAAVEEEEEDEEGTEEGSSESKGEDGIETISLGGDDESAEDDADVDNEAPGLEDADDKHDEL